MERPETSGDALVPSRYRVHLLSRAKPTDRGVVYLRGDEQFLLAWHRVERASAAEVGEHDGVRSVVFDLAVTVRGPECVACRLAARPDEAQRLARAIQLGVAPRAATPSLAAVAQDGACYLRYADLETLDAAALESIRFES